VALDASLAYELVFPGSLWRRLVEHLFRPDGDEHGAVIAAGIARSDGRVRLLARHVFVARDGIEYVASQRGYRMLTAEFVREQILFCRDEELAYLAVHNHGGQGSVAFSADDLRSHERGYPALRDIARGQLVGGLVVAQNAVAGDLWVEGGRAPLRRTRVLGHNIDELFASPPARPANASPTYDRQARLFGDRGQALLRAQRVGVIGLGGIGSLVTEYLSRLGVGSLVLIDPERLDPTNVPRVVGSTPRDAASLLARGAPTSWLHRGAKRLARWKVDIAAREARRAHPEIEIEKHAKSVVEADVAQALAACDYLFLAADSMQARLVFNALVQQFLIPGVQLGVKVSVDSKTGRVGHVFSVARPVLPGQGCLWCNGLITPGGLQHEALSPEERRAQRYVEEEDLPAPSVIALNALAAAHGVNDYLFRLTGLREPGASEDYVYLEPRRGNLRLDMPRQDAECSECSSSMASRFARGDARPLPVVSKRAPRSRRVR